MKNILPLLQKSSAALAAMVYVSEGQSWVRQCDLLAGWCLCSRVSACGASQLLLNSPQQFSELNLVMKLAGENCCCSDRSSALQCGTQNAR